jgi:hypothetical protein
MHQRRAPTSSPILNPATFELNQCADWLGNYPEIPDSCGPLPRDCGRHPLRHAAATPAGQRCRRITAGTLIPPAARALEERAAVVPCHVMRPPRRASPEPCGALPQDRFQTGGDSPRRWACGRGGTGPLSPIRSQDGAGWPHPPARTGQRRACDRSRPPPPTSAARHQGRVGRHTVHYPRPARSPLPPRRRSAERAERRRSRA